MRNIIHTRVGQALADASTWPSLAAVVLGAYSLPSPWRELVIGFGVIGVLLKGGRHVSDDNAQ